MKFFDYVLARAKEASTWAAISTLMLAVLPVVGVPVLLATKVVGITAAISIALKSHPDAP